MPFLLNALRSSRNFRFRLIGVDARQVPASTLSLLDVFALVPGGSQPNYAARMADIALRERAELIWPGSDEEAGALSRQRASFESIGVSLMTSPEECLDLIRDKAAVYRLLEKHGIRTPVHRVARGRADIETALKAFDFPAHSIVVKPTTGRGGRGVTVLCGRHAPEPWIGTGARERRLGGTALPEGLTGERFDAPVLVMPTMRSPVYDADVLARKGDVLACVVRRRDNPAGIPFTGSLVMRAPETTAFCARIAAALQLDSLHDYDLMTDNEGNIQLLEINPRPSGSFVATLAAGIPLADAAIGRHIGVSIPCPPVMSDVHVSRVGDRLLIKPAAPRDK